MFLSQYFTFPLSVSFHQCSIFILIYMLLLLKKQTGEAKPVKLPKSSALSVIGKHWIVK
jgi:hypothetical protein